MNLLQALLRNESGGRNIANTTQGTSSGQAQGYFQITTGTWNDFGGQKYAPTPLQASYEQQADIASKIPLRRWDESTVNLMRATGRPIDVNRTLGENLAMNGESFAGGARDGGQATAYAGDVGGLARGQVMNQKANAPVNYDYDTTPIVAADLGIDADLGFSSPLADALAESVRSRRDEGPDELKRKPEPDLPTLDYASAVPEAAPTAGQEPSLSAPALSIPQSQLADLFQVADIGGADRKNARLPTVDYGAAYPRRRREA